ncbi:MAG TPA: hypothetical protein VMB73_31235 [Acetobacteraceae bacterium]|nr:hypothetical protein [Acetobacteraceae bacterium]
MQSFDSMPRGAAVWLALAVGSVLLLQGCGAQPGPQAPQPRLFSSDFQGAAKSCTVPKPSLAAGKETAAAMTVANDGGWCAISVADDGKPYASGLLTELPAHGEVYIHPVGNMTRIDYTPDVGFAGSDAFAVRLLPGNPVLRVSVTVRR